MTILILNETWNNKLNILGYNESSHMRTNQRGGGVVKEWCILKSYICDKNLLNRNKF